MPGASMTRGRRVLLGVLLALGLGGSAFAAAAVIAARCCVSPDSGLAGPAIVAGYGILGGLLGALAGAALAIVLAPRTLGIATILAGTGGLLVYGALFSGYLVARSETAAHLQQAYERLPKLRMTLTRRQDIDPDDFLSFSADWQARQYVVSRHGRSCTAQLTGAEAVELLSALREVELVMHQDPFPCAGTLGRVVQELEFYIPSPTPPDSSSKLAITAACLERYPNLDGPLAAAQRLHRDHGWPADC